MKNSDRPDKPARSGKARSGKTRPRHDKPMDKPRGNPTRGRSRPAPAEESISDGLVAGAMAKTGNDTETVPLNLVSERVQKVMASAGMGSRRSLEKQIEQGAVQINGKTASLGDTVSAGNRILFRDQWWLVTADSTEHRTLIYNKPEGELTTRSDPDGRATVFDKMPWVSNARWVAIGRLDINTTGLLLMTTDGELANAMMHPSNQIDREYVCRIRGMVSDEQVEQLMEGVILDDGPAKFSDIQRLPGASGNQWFQVTLLEGRNREVRRLWESVGCMVSRLKRVRYGAARLPRGLKVGRFSEITSREHRILRHDVKLSAAGEQLALEPVKERGGKTDSKKAQGKPARPASRPAGQRAARPPSKPRNRATGPARPTTKSASRTYGKPQSKPGSPTGAGRRTSVRKDTTGRK